MSTNEKKKIEYSKCFCYGKGNCGPYTRLKVDNMYRINKLKENVQNHLVNIKVNLLILLSEFRCHLLYYTL